MLIGIIAVTVFLATVSANGKTTNTIVLIASEQQRSEFTELAAQMASQFSESDVDFLVHWIKKLPTTLREQERLGADIAEQHRALAVFWCDLTIAERAYFYVSTADTGRLLVRRLTGVGPEGLNDALAMISLTAVEGLLRGGMIGIQEPASSETTSPTSDAPPDAEPESSTAAFSLSAAYTMSLISPELGISQGALFSAGFAPNPWFGLALGYGIYGPISDREQNAEIILQRHPIFITVRGRAQRGRWWLGGSLSFTIDYMTKSPQAHAENMIIDDPYSDLHFSVLPALLVEFEVTSVFHLFFSVGLEAHINKVKYEITNGPTLMEDAWQVQPTLQAGAVFYFSKREK